MEVQKDIQNGFSLLIDYTKAEINRVGEVIKQAQIMEAALMKSLQSLQQVDPHMLNNIGTGDITQLNEKLNSLREPGYPYKGHKEEKVLFLLKKINSASRISELVDEILRIEGGTDGRSVSKSLNYKMNQMVADGKLVIAKINRSNRHVFYCLPEFFSNLEKGDITIKEEYLPTEKSWGKLPIEERTFAKVKWISFIK